MLLKVRFNNTANITTLEVDAIGIAGKESLLRKGRIDRTILGGASP